MTGVLALAGAIGLEVASTLTLKSMQGGLAGWLAVASGYAAAFFLLRVSLGVVPVGVAYGIWAGAGTVGVALLGSTLLGERLAPVAWLGIALVVLGVILLGSAHLDEMGP